MGPDQNFAQLEDALRSQGAAGVFDALIQSARDRKNYPLVFEVRMMQKRHALGLPLIEIDDVPQTHRAEYEQGLVGAAREVANLFLADGDIERAWNYFRAIHEPGAVADAIERIPAGEASDRVVEIAFYEGANPRKGFEWILERRGVCGALTAFSRYPDIDSRQDALGRLVRVLYGDLEGSLRRTIAEEEGQAPAGGVAELIQGRDWLFEGINQYIDSTHVATILAFSRELEDREVLRLAWEIAEYGDRLDEMYHFRGDPPFEDTYRDHAIYLRALLGEEIDAAIAHFRGKTSEGAAEVAIDLLVRSDRYAEAIQVSLESLNGVRGAVFGCPSAAQLCQMAGDYEQLGKLARQQEDGLAFAAAVIQMGSRTSTG